MSTLLMTATVQTTASFHSAYCARPHIKIYDKSELFVAELLLLCSAIRKMIRLFGIRGN